MSAMQKVKDALLKAGFSGEKSRECAEGGEKTPRSPHVAMDFVRRALDASAPWWQSQGAEPKNGERIVNSPVEKETRPTALGAGRHMEAMQRKAGSRPPLGKLPDMPKGMADDEAITEDALVMDADSANAELAKMQSDLDAHDKQYHGGAYKGGACKLRDKVAKAAKNLGMGGQAIKNLVGPKGGAGAGGAAGAGGGGEKEKFEETEEVAVTETLDPNKKKGGIEGGDGGGETESPEVPDEAEKKFKDSVSAIKAEHQRLLDEAKNAPDRKQREKKLAKTYKKKMLSARMEYLTNALNMSPAEAGACAEIAQKVDEGSPEAKKVVEEIAQNPNLTDQQKAAVEVVNSGVKESANGEATATAGGTASPAAEPTDAQFEDELKKAFPDKAQMIDKLSQNFDTLNSLLNDEQKKKFWDLNNGGDDEAFYTFLGDECGFSADEVSALRDLTDAYRAANPNDYPEYAEQHKHDELLARVKKADRRLNNDVKRGKLSGIKNRLEIKGFSNEEIEQYMDAMGLTEDQKFAVMNDLPVPPKVPTPEEMAQKKAEQSAAEKMDAYRKAYDQASRDNNLDDPETAQKLNDLLKDAMEAQKAAKNPAPAAPTAAPAQETTAPADGTASAETGTGGEKAESSAPTPTAKATKEEVAAQPKEDPVSEGMTPEDHAKVCKANPKSNCPFLRAHMAPEALAALDKPEGAQPAATGETSTTAPATGENAAPATGTAQPTAEPTEGAVPPDSSGGETAAPAAETTEPSTETTSPAPASEAPAEAPPPLPAGPAEPLPEYTVPNVNGKELALSDEEHKYLDDLRNAYANEPNAEKRAQIEAEYNQFTADLDAEAAMLQAQSDVEKDARAQEAEKKQPGFIQNMKNFFGGMLKSMNGDKPIGFEMSPEERRYLGLPETGTIRQSEYRAANARAIARENARKAEEAKKAKEEAEKAEAEKGSWRANGGVKTSSGEQSEVVNDSFLDRSQAKEGGLKNKEDATKKIKDVLGGEGIDTSKLQEKSGPYSTKYTIVTKDLSKSELDKIRKGIIRAIDRWDEDDGSSKTTVSYNPDSSRLTVMIPHEKDERGDLPFAKVFDSPEWKKAVQDGTIPLLFGEDDNGKPVIADLDDLVHLLVAGTTGAGKSARMNSILISALMSRSPDELGVWLIDPKRVEFSGFKKDKHLLGPVASSAEEAQQTLKEVQEEVEKRNKLLAEVSEKTDLTIKDATAYNKLAKEGKIPKEYPQFIKPAMLVIDEFSELSTQGGKKIDEQLGSLARLARSSGIHLILATQRPDADTITGQIRSNIPSRMGLKTTDDHGSKMIFGKTGVGAENLAKKGPFILKTDDGIIRGNGAYINDDEINSYHQEDMKINGKTESPKPPSNPNAPQPVPKDKRSSDTHIANMPDGMEVHKGDGGRIYYKYGGRQYKQAERRNPDGSVTKGWKLADGSDPRLYVLKKPSTPPAS